ncbi:MAG: hypothetical protein AB1Z65_18165, partial [Candidatus Sulfomarinibacteraceae bacterium]
GSLTCGAGQLAKWNGATWVCAPDLDTDTLSGLSCATWQIPKWNGSIWECNYDWDTLYNLGCSATQIPKHNGSIWVCAEDADTTYNLGPGLVLDGGTIRVDPAEFATQITTIDVTGTVDSDHFSLAIGADGLGLIAYYDSAAQLLRVAHCLNPTCTGVEVNTLDSTPTAGMYPSVAIGTDGLAVISYWAGPAADNLKVAHCDNLSCSSATIQSISAQCGRHSSIAIGSDGFPLIAYNSSYNLFEVAHCLDIACSAVEFGVPGFPLAEHISLAIGADGFGLIVFAYYWGESYYVAHCENLNCSVATVSLLAHSNTRSFDPGCSITVGTDGLGVIAYNEVDGGRLQVVRCDDDFCTTFSGPQTFSFLYYSPVILGVNERPLFVIGGSNGEVIRCIDQSCLRYDTTATDIETYGELSAAKGPNGRVLVAYVDGSKLRVARLPVGY